MTSRHSRRGVTIALWIAYVLALAASVQHVAATFEAVNGSGALNGWASALAVDAGLAALAYGIQQRRRAERRSRGLWAALAFFASISAYANFRHAVTSGASWFDALAFGATLPALVVVLGEIISATDAADADRADAARRRADAKAERELSQVAEAAPTVAEPVSAVAQMAQPGDAVAYAAANGVSVRTAYRRLAAERVNGRANGR